MWCVQQTIPVLSYSHLLLSWRTWNPFIELKQFSVKRPIVAWSMNQRDQSGPFWGQKQTPPQTNHKSLVPFFLSLKLLRLHSVCTPERIHAFVRSHRLLACLSDALFSVSYSCATPPLALAPVYHTWLQAMQRDNENKRIDCFDHTLYHKCMYCSCSADNPLCSPPLLVITQSYHAMSCSDTKAANFYQEPKL